jgi:hypothetical protein
MKAIKFFNHFRKIIREEVQLVIREELQILNEVKDKRNAIKPVFKGNNLLKNILEETKNNLVNENISNFNDHDVDIVMDNNSTVNKIKSVDDLANMDFSGTLKKMDEIAKSSRPV